MKLPGLKAARVAARITQYDLAGMAKVTPQTISNIESGGPTRWKTAEKLAKALKVKVEQLEEEATTA